MFREVCKVLVIPTSWVSTLETNLKEIKVVMVDLCGVAMKCTSLRYGHLFLTLKFSDSIYSKISELLG